MLSYELSAIVDAVISTIKPGALAEEQVQQLRAIFPDTLLLAALDIVDRDSVIKFNTPWGYSCFEVLGSTGTYTIFPNLNLTPSAKGAAYCTCPAFAYAVLISESHVTCKHVLATRIAVQMSRCIERPVTQDGLAAILVRQCA
ncbi:hypothetical protein PLICRDRAFT_172610 [Plicaturopsis crispa FD-325 SS-3]|nr:hypothetical protein PLICRDRAFT_172610 [Plicaturopsis crispa FD-325 SS-3]